MVDVTAEILDELPPEMAANDGELDDKTCEICSYVSVSPRGLKRHRTVTHGIKSGTSMSAGRPAKKSLEEDLATTLAALAMAVSLFDNYDGMVISQHGPVVARAWSNLAQKNPHVDRVLRSMMGGVSYGEVIMATMMMVMPIMAHHKLLPADLSKIFVPVEPTVTDGD